MEISCGPIQMEFGEQQGKLRSGETLFGAEGRRAFVLQSCLASKLTVCVGKASSYGEICGIELHIAEKITVPWLMSMVYFPLIDHRG